MGRNTLVINEMYPAIIGESSLAGFPCALVRLAGCNLRCSYCDTGYAYGEGTVTEVDKLVSAVVRGGYKKVLVTGGEPLCQPGCADFLRRLLDAGLLPLVETNGSISIRGLPRRAHVVMDLKSPGSGMHRHNLPENLDALKPSDDLKVVLTGRKDYLWARRQLQPRLSGSGYPFTVIFSPAWGLLAPSLLAGWILKDKLPVKLGLQLHKYIFGEKRGV